MISRRDFLKNSMALGALGSFNPLPGQYLTTEHLEVTYLAVNNHKIPDAFKGYKIAFISDMHCGVFLSDEFLNRVLTMVSKENPDLLILGGDYIGIPDSIYSQFFAYLKSSQFYIKRSRELVTKIFHGLGEALNKVKFKDGIFAVLGNHDHWNDGDICTSVLSDYGVKFLINQETAIEKNSQKIILYGSDDYWTGIPKISDNFLNNNKSSFKVLISHNPDFIAEVLYSNKICFDLSLSGHTHGGQIYINGLGPVYGYNIRHTEFAMGTKRYENSIIHTSKGIGVVDVPIRLNSKPEITIITLSNT